MFDKHFGKWRLHKKLAMLLRSVLDEDAVDASALVNVTDSHLVAAGRTQVLRVEQEVCNVVEPGVYFLAGRYLMPVGDAFGDEYPDVEPALAHGNFTKTATLLHLDDRPMAAMWEAAKEFCARVDVDGVRKTICRLGALGPKYVRACGGDGKGDAGEAAMNLELLYEADGKIWFYPNVIEYMALAVPASSKDFVVVHDAPMLFDLKDYAS